MKKTRNVLIALFALALILSAGAAMAGWGDAIKKAGDAGAKAAGLSYTPSEAESAIKEVLSMGTDSAASTLSQDGGFSSSSTTAFSLPDSLSSLGQSSGLLSMFNTGAEDAIPGVSKLFDQSIDDLDVTNSASMLGSSSSSTSITDYFESQSRPTLKELAKPIVAESLDNAGMGSYSSALSMASQAAGFDPVDYATDQTLDAMFHYIGKKEASLRSTGGEGASALLQKIF